MERVQKVVVILLIVAIVFSVASIVMSLSFSNSDLPKQNVQTSNDNRVNSNNIELVVLAPESGGESG